MPSVGLSRHPHMHGIHTYTDSHIYTHKYLSYFFKKYFTSFLQGKYQIVRQLLSKPSILVSGPLFFSTSGRNILWNHNRKSSMVNITLITQSLPHLINCDVPCVTYGCTLSGQQPSVWYIPASWQMPRNALCCITTAVKTRNQNRSALYSLRDHQGYFSPANMEVSYATQAHNWINKARAPYSMCYWLEGDTDPQFLHKPIPHPRCSHTAASSCRSSGSWCSFFFFSSSRLLGKVLTNVSGDSESPKCYVAPSALWMLVLA